MITLIEALNYRCLRYIKQPLGPFHVLVGPNASGKTTFLDVVGFLGRLISDGLDAAVEERTRNFQDLIWGRRGAGFELAIEAAIPEGLQVKTEANGYDVIRYELGLHLERESTEVSIVAEKVLLKRSAALGPVQRDLFPYAAAPPRTIISGTARHGQQKLIVNKVRGGNDVFYSETYSSAGKGWVPAFKLGPRKSALGNLPADERKLPAATWLKGLLDKGVQQLVLNSLLIRKASPPGQGRGFKPDGSNLPWVVAELDRKSHPRFEDWIAHLRTALPDLEGIRTVEREDDKHRYLVLQYRGGLEVPSWMASDGTLRLLALTLPAYLPDLSGIFLIEEPENGIHPRAVEAMFQSLSSVYGAQVLLATHSPVILGIVDADKVLCFAKTAGGETDIVSGANHPALRDWKGETNLGVLFAGGVLG
ncbi:MAG: ATP-binding protein [Thermoanaerobaculaceae bacterium]|jgi:predicted ATPase|nr:ATP-binding protein [Thermoanaerobaculaceae bacterium]